jgi:hypothetical protein
MLFLSLELCLILLVPFAILCILSELERFGLATLTLIATLVGAQCFHLADILGFMQHHTVESLVGVGMFLVVGVVWSFAKWFFFLVNFRDKFRELRTAWFVNNKLDPTQPLPDDLKLKSEGVDPFGWSYRAWHNMQKPRASDNKSRIIGWMAFWPFSMVGTLLNDPIRKLFTWLFNQLKGLYQRMADKILGNEMDMSN